MKRRFGVSVLASGMVLIVFLVVLRFAVHEDAGTEIAVFSIGVDVVIGVFTVFGLYWAAVEFSESRVEPKVVVRLESPELSCSLEKPDYWSVRWTRVVLENKTSKAGRNILVVIEYAHSPQPPDTTNLHVAKHCPLVNPKMASVSVCWPHPISLPIDESVVVYERPLHLGYLKMAWHSKTPPTEVQLKCCVYTLDGSYCEMQTLPLAFADSGD